MSSFYFTVLWVQLNLSKIKERNCLGIIKADEIMVINGAIVSDLDMMYIESVLQVCTLYNCNMYNSI